MFATPSRCIEGDLPQAAANTRARAKRTPRGKARSNVRHQRKGNPSTKARRSWLKWPLTPKSHRAVLKPLGFPNCGISTAGLHEVGVPRPIWWGQPNRGEDRPAVDMRSNFKVHLLAPHRCTSGLIIRGQDHLQVFTCSIGRAFPENPVASRVLWSSCFLRRLQMKPFL